MRSRAVAVLAAGCALGTGALALGAAADERSLAFTLNVAPLGPVAVAQPGEEACQRDVQVAARFDVVQILLGTFARPGPPLTVTVRESGGRRALAAGTLPAGAPDNRAASVRLRPAVEEGQRVDVCVRDDGAHRVALYGGFPYDDPIGDAFVGGRPAAGDIRMSFYRSEPRSALSLLPAMFGRAALFRPDPFGPWAFWALLAVVALGVPMLLGAALRRADEPARTGDARR